MCGIAGFLGNSRGVDTRAMLDALVHRGPDDEGEHRADYDALGTLWLGHRRLAIQDLSRAGRQPMHSRDGRYAIVFNGEIYNFKDLRAELVAHGERFATGTDTEVILAAWALWGARAVERLRGMFAFALWDSRERTLFLARDRIGEKPLYYTHDGERFAFASELRALLAGGCAARELDSEGVDSYLTFGAVAEPFTIVHGVKMLGPGEVLTLRDGAHTLRTYWSVRDLPSLPAGDRREATALTRERLMQSVHRCMVADVPVAVLLSGGIDSSSNVCLLTEQRWQNLQTFSVVFNGPDAAFSEAPYSTLVAEKFHTRHQQVEVGLGDDRELLERAFDAMDSPTADGVNTWLVCDAIRRAGIKVAVTGQGADELFLGYAQRRLYPTIERSLRVLPAPLRASLEVMRPTLPIRRGSQGEKVLQAFTSSDAVAGAYLAQHAVFSHAAIEALRGESRPRPERFVRSMGGTDPLDRLSRLQLTQYLRNVLLRDGDQMSMAHAVELRAPFIDSDLIEAVVPIASSLKVDARRNKPLLLDAVGPELPREVWDRPKRGFGTPYRRWLHEALPTMVEGPEVGLDADAVRSVRERFLAGQHPTRYWALQVLGRWARRHRMGASHL